MAFSLSSVSPLAWLIGIGWLLLPLWMIRLDEPHLDAQFGDEMRPTPMAARVYSPPPLTRLLRQTCYCLWSAHHLG